MPGSLAIAAVSGSTTLESFDDIDGNEQWTVEAGPEATGQQVVGAPFGSGVRQSAVIGEAEAQRQHRSGQHDQQPAR